MKEVKIQEKTAVPSVRLPTMFFVGLTRTPVLL